MDKIINRNNVPKLRFGEFNNEWKEVKLKDLSTDISYGMNVPATDYDGENKYIRITDIDEETSLYTNNNVSPLGILDDKFLLKENDILFARTGASTGKTYLYDKKDGKLYYAGFLIKAHIKDNYIGKFIFEQTKLNKYYNWVRITSMRSGQPGINSLEYGNYKFAITSIFEQQKIANFFTLIDKKINLQTQKVELLKKYKKALLEKIYKEKLKAIKLVNLKELAHLQGGFAFESKLFTKKGMPIIRISNINENIIDLKDVVYYNAEILIDSKFEVNKGDMLIAMSGATTGKFGIYNDTKKAYLNQRVGKLILHKKDIIYSYLYFLFELNSYNIQLKNRLVAGAQPNISPSDIEALKFKIPSINVQKNIIDIYNSISKKIRENENKLKNLKDLKKGLLQKMFI